MQSLNALFDLEGLVQSFIGLIFILMNSWLYAIKKRKNSLSMILVGSIINL